MWTFLSKPRELGFALITVFAITDTAYSQTANVTNNNQTFGFNLPNPVVPHGFDEVRAADGTTCRSSIAGSGPYMDLGGLNTQDGVGYEGGATVYGRIVIPLGKKPGRIDCRSLYQLEIDRLQHELHLARSGLRGGSQANFSDGFNNNTPQQ